MSTAAAPTRPANRRAIVLDAAAELFAQRGYDGVSVADIAGSVGVTAPALYRHFPNKEALLASIILGAVDRLDQVIADAGPDTDLAACVPALVAEVLDRPRHVVTYLRERHRLAGADARAQARRERRYLDSLGALAAAERPELTADQVAIRVVGAIGVLRGFAERPPALPRPAADAFLAAAVVDLLVAPPEVDGPGSGPAPTGWEPPASPRERILQAALPLFRARGFAGVGIGELGDAAGVGASNVHRYFDSKDEILVDIYDRVGAQVEAGLDAAMAASTDAADAFDRMVSSYCEVAFAAGDLIVVVAQNRGALPASERPRLRRRDRRIMDLWRAVVAEVRPELRANELATLIAGILPLVNMFPQQQLVTVPSVPAAAALVRAYVLGDQVSAVSPA